MAYLDENGLEHFWGKIKDRVSSAVAPKANDADVVHKTGDETVEGVKTFQNTAEGHTAGDTVTDLVIRNPEVVRGTDGSGRSFTRVILADAEGDTEETFAGRLGLLEVVSPKENDTNREELRLNCYKYSDAPADYGKVTGFTVGYDVNEIPYATAPATSDERTNPKDIVTRGYMEASEWNWQKTKKDALVQFKPIPESDLEPVVDFMFTETPPAEGEKGPENPSTITGISSINVVRCGKNLVPYPYSHDTCTINDVSFTVNSDGSILIDGTATSNAVFFLNNTVKKAIYFPGVTYTFSGFPLTAASGIGFNIDLYSFEESPQYKATKNYRIGSFTVDEIMYGRQYLVVNASSTAQNLLAYPQIEASISSSSYEKPVYDRYTIQLGDTYYGGSLDVATGVMTVTHVKETITSVAGGSAFDSVAVFNAWPSAAIVSGESATVCEELPYADGNVESEHWRNLTATSGTVGCYVYLLKSRLDVSGAVDPSNPTIAEWRAAANAYLAVNPLHFVFTLVTPFTVQLAPTQIRSLSALDKYEPRINTVYTDQEAVQVGYQRFANYVDLTTDQTVDGNKTFVDTVAYEGNHNTAFQAKITSIERGNVTNSIYKMPFFVTDKNDNKTGGLYEEFLSSGGHAFALLTYDATSINNTFAYFKVGFDANQIEFANAPSTSFKRANVRDIVTRSYITSVNVYVDPVNGDDSNEGTSSSAAFKTINTAISKVSHVFSCNIVLAAGTYTENIDFHTCRNFVFKPSGNVVINGYLQFRRNSFLHIYPSVSNITFTVKELLVRQNSYFLCDCKFITNNNGINCSDESIVIFNQGLEVIANSGTDVDGITVGQNSFAYIVKEITLHNGNVANSNINTAIHALSNSTIIIQNCTTNITCLSYILQVENNAFVRMYNSSYSDLNNVFTGTTSGIIAISAMSGTIRSDNVKMSITATRDENNSSYLIVNLNDSSTFRLSNSQLNLTCTGKAYNFIGVFYNSVFIFGSSNSLTFNGASYSGTINCQYNSCAFISSAATVSGTVTSGYRFYVARGGQINIQGHSAGLNRIPGASAGVVESSSYGFYG